MENAVFFSGKHGEWSFARRLRLPSDDFLPFLSSLGALVNQRCDYYLSGSFDLQSLHDVLDGIVKGRSDINKAVSSAIRSRAVQSELSAIISEFPLDKKQTSAFKDILKIYNVRYVLSEKIGDFEHIFDVGEAEDPRGEGYFFVANADGWVAVKKQRVDNTSLIDLPFYFASLSNTLHSKAQELITIQKPDGRLKPGDACALALEVSGGGRNLCIYDLALKEYMELAGAPIHYGVAYNRIRPPKRIRGAKTK